MHYDHDNRGVTLWIVSRNSMYLHARTTLSLSSNFPSPFESNPLCVKLFSSAMPHWCCVDNMHRVIQSSYAYLDIKWPSLRLVSSLYVLFWGKTSTVISWSSTWTNTWYITRHLTAFSLSNHSLRDARFGAARPMRSEGVTSFVQSFDNVLTVCWSRLVIWDDVLLYFHPPREFKLDNNEFVYSLASGALNNRWLLCRQNFLYLRGGGLQSRGLETWLTFK